MSFTIKKKERGLTMEDNKLYPEQTEELTTAGEESANWKEEQAASPAATAAVQEEQTASSAVTGADQEEQAASPAATGADQEEQTESAAASSLSHETPVLDVRFGEQPDTAGMAEDHHNEAYQAEALQPQPVGNSAPYFNNGDQSSAPYFNNGDQNSAPCFNNHYQNTASYQDNNYPNEQPWQGGTYPNNGYQHQGYYDNGQSTGCQGYQNYQNSQTAGGQSMDGQNASCYNGALSGTGGQNYDGGYQQYNSGQPYQNTYQHTYQNAYQNPYQNNSQMELEEPVKISEWVLAMVLMMIPCVNIIMMFVWAFSSTEKKSKSNFFKAYLIFFGISMGVMLLVWVAIVFFAMLSY